jgi:hypothetical protein
MAEIRSEWHKEEYSSGVKKEILGGKAFFKWCCGLRMRRILGFQKMDGKTYRIGLGIPSVIGWYCQVCERREENSGTIGM